MLCWKALPEFVAETTFLVSEGTRIRKVRAREQDLTGDIFAIFKSAVYDALKLTDGCAPERLERAQN